MTENKFVIVFVIFFILFSAAIIFIGVDIAMTVKRKNQPPTPKHADDNEPILASGIENLPGNRVLITKTIRYYPDDDMGLIVAPENSIARALSIEEYTRLYKRQPLHLNQIDREYGWPKPENVKESMLKGTSFPFQLVSVGSAIHGYDLQDREDFYIGRVVFLSPNDYQMLES